MKILFIQILKQPANIHYTMDPFATQENTKPFLQIWKARHTLTPTCTIGVSGRAEKIIRILISNSLFHIGKSR